jgi:multidrug resistance efflux pump
VLTDVALLDAKIAEAEAEVANLEAKSSAEERKARERQEDLKRLKRVEVIYVSKGLSVATGR